MRALRWTAGACALLTFGLIVLGAVVRATNSGLSCPDWPTCYGHWLPLPSDLEAVPNMGYAYWQVMLEWIHRVVAAFMLGPLVLVLAVLCVRQRRRLPGLVFAAGLLIGLLLIQKLLGGITVLDRNSPWSVALHLGNALFVLTVILLIFERAGGTAPATRFAAIGWLGAGAWLLALLAMASAAMTAKSGSSLACSTWPLCDGALIPDLSDPGVAIHFTHRSLAAATGLAVLLVFVVSRMRSGVPGALRQLAAVALALVGAQILLGASVIVFEVPRSLAVLHQAVGVATFATVTLLMWRCLPAAWRPVDGQQAVGEGDGLALRSA
ncbi:COX15/CtaA family protein [Geminicoccaceae bacterium 1502E]|nr:COX15/CtaA family protein [Geminicoccaceae bacterium 1502E]